MLYYLFKYTFILLLWLIICSCSKHEVIEETYQNGNPRKIKIYRRWLFSKEQTAVEYILSEALEQDLITMDEATYYMDMRSYAPWLEK